MFSICLTFLLFLRFKYFRKFTFPIGCELELWHENGFDFSKTLTLALNVSKLLEILLNFIYFMKSELLIIVKN